MSAESEIKILMCNGNLKSFPVKRRVKGEKSELTEKQSFNHNYSRQRNRAIFTHGQLPHGIESRFFITLDSEQERFWNMACNAKSMKRKFDNFWRIFREAFPDAYALWKMEFHRNGNALHFHLDLYPGEGVAIEKLRSISGEIWQKQMNSQWADIVDVRPMTKQGERYFWKPKKKPREMRFKGKFPRQSFCGLKGIGKDNLRQPKEWVIPADALPHIQEILKKELDRQAQANDGVVNEEQMRKVNSRYIGHNYLSEEAEREIEDHLNSLTKGADEMGLFVKQKEAAEYLGMNYHTFRRLIKEYPIPKHGPKLNYFDKEELVAWMKGKRWKVVDPIPKAVKTEKVPSLKEQLDRVMGPKAKKKKTGWGCFYYGLTG